MTTARKIEKLIGEFSEGKTFNYYSCGILPAEFPAAAKSFQRLIAKGIIKRLKPGLFYKPRKSIFGELGPGEVEILKQYLFEKGKRIAYITGTALYNQMALTTQVPKSIRIASFKKRVSISIGSLKAKPAKSYIEVSESNYQLLGILDAIKDFKKIPDLNKEAAILVILKTLTGLHMAKLELLLEYSLMYPPRARSLLGALLEQIYPSLDLSKLKLSLNPLTKYDYKISSILPTSRSWNIL